MRKTLLTPFVIVASLVAAILIPASANAATTATTSVIPTGSTGWSYYRGTTAPPTTWKTAPVTTWKQGAAPLGFGTSTGTLGTTIPNTFTTKPLATYVQKSFTLTSVPQAGATLSTWADDGLVIYVNGVEVVRKNLPTGTISNTSYATAAPMTTAAKAATFTAAVPASALKVGTNLVSVQVQSNYRATPNVTFDMSLSVPTPPAPAPAPVDPSEAAAAAWGTPTWQDEFTYTDPATGKPAVDPGKWNVRDRSDLGLLFDAAVPDKGQVTVDANGIAHLKADWLSTPIQRPAGQTGPTIWHKTGYMDQRSLETGDVTYAQQYGRWEIRAKTPTGPKTYGSLAAFWLRNSQSGEIDIMEAWGYNEKAAPGGQRIDTATTTVHTNTTGVNNDRYIWHHADFGAKTPVWDAFHTYAFEFTPSYAAVYVDGVRLLEATPKSHPNLWNPNYFGSPLHVRLNLHVGPSAQYWGLPDPNNKSWTQNLDYQVDYVRIWKYKG